MVGVIKSELGHQIGLNGKPVGFRGNCNVAANDKGSKAAKMMQSSSVKLRKELGPKSDLKK